MVRIRIVLRKGARLRELGCDEAHDYLYSRPQPVEDLLEWLRKHRLPAPRELRPSDPRTPGPP